MPTPEVKPAPLRDTNYQNKIIELIDFDKEKNRYNHDAQSSNQVNKINDLYFLYSSDLMVDSCIHHKLNESRKD